MNISDILILIILTSLWIFGIIIYINLQQVKMLIATNLLEPKSPPKVKSKKLRYNPADLFNPYKYESEDDLDPVVPGNELNGNRR